MAAHDYMRHWSDIDVSSKAFNLAKRRIENRGGLLYNIIYRIDVPQPTDLGPVPPNNSLANKT